MELHGLSKVFGHNFLMSLEIKIIYGLKFRPY